MKMLKALLPTAAAVILAVGVSHADFFYKWSQTANSNANSDSFTWAEGQAPSTVNDSARGMMAALAKYRDDVSGKLVTTGTATAFALTTNSVFSSLALMDGAELAFRMNATSGAAPTLNVDTLGAKALNQSTGVAVATGALISGAVYRAVYVNATNEWIVQGIAGQVPSGTTMLSTSTACPTGWTISSAANDRTLVISSSAGGTAAGTTAFSTYFSGSSVVGSTTLTTAQIPAHGHGYSGTTSDVSADHTHGVVQAQTPIGSGSGSFQASSGGLGTVQTGGESNGHTHTFGGTTDGAGLGGGSHNHTIPSVQSVTAIGCTKN